MRLKHDISYISCISERLYFHQYGLYPQISLLKMHYGFSLKCKALKSVLINKNILSCCSVARCGTGWFITSTMGIHFEKLPY